MGQFHHKRILLLYLLIACTTGFNSVYAQQCDPSDECHCSAGSVSPAGIMVGHPHEKGGWMLSYRYMFMNMNNTQQGKQRVPAETVFSQYLMSPTDMQMQMHMVMGMYGVTDRISVMGMVQYQTATMYMDMFSNASHQHGGVDTHGSKGRMDMATSGLGDTKWYVSIALSDTKSHSLVLSGGVNIPTGSITHSGEASSMYPNVRLPYMMQLGSGTVDFMPGITYNRLFGKWQWSIQGTGVYRPFYNAIGYRLGHEATLTTWGVFRLMESLSISARAEATQQGAIDGRDVTLYSGMEPSANYRNYGGTKVSTFIGVTCGATKGWLSRHKFSVEGGLPVYQYTNGIQLVQQTNLFAGWIVSF